MLTGKRGARGGGRRAQSGTVSPGGVLIEEEAVGGGDLVAEGLDGGREAPVRRLEVGCGADRGGVVGCGAEIPAEIDLTPSCFCLQVPIHLSNAIQ